MTSEQIKLVKKSWKMLIGVDPALVGDTFYSKLFMDNPSIRKLFPQDMNMQYVKLVDMLSAIVISLDNPERMNADLIAMGERHVKYGVKPAHYKLVGSALIWTLEKALAADWNDQLKNAWVACYDHICSVMLEPATP